MVKLGPYLKGACAVATSTLFLNVFFILPASAQTEPSPQTSTISSTSPIGPADTKSGMSIRVESDLVLIPVNVTDAMNRPVVGLQKDNFLLFDESQEQQIRFLSNEDAPLTIGLILDVSNSMADKISAEQEALAEFLKQSHPDDEYFVVAVSSKAKIVADSDPSIGDIQGKLTLVKPSGYTALLDAVHLALERMRSARYPRRAIVIISDGGDNVSRYKARQVYALARESDVLMYAIRPFAALPLFRTIEERIGGGLLAGLTESTGGRTISVSDGQKIPEAAAAVSRELRNQYVLAYKPASAQFDGRWHKIKVRMAQSGTSAPSKKYTAPLQVRYRKGYTAYR
jgi:Ca-activated chloride channel homolog